MVDDIDNRVDEQVAGWQLAMLLVSGFRTLVDEAHHLLAEQGHPDVRPSYGFALQAIGDGATTSDLAGRLGVSKQAAAKTVAALEGVGYVGRSVDPLDARRRTVVRTARGTDLLDASERAFEEVVARWRRRTDVDAVGRALLDLDLSAGVRVDLGAWSR